MICFEVSDYICVYIYIYTWYKRDIYVYKRDTCCIYILCITFPQRFKENQLGMSTFAFFFLLYRLSFFSSTSMYQTGLHFVDGPRVNRTRYCFRAAIWASAGDKSTGTFCFSFFHYLSPFFFFFFNTITRRCFFSLSHLALVFLCFRSSRF